MPEEKAPAKEFDADKYFYSNSDDYTRAYYDALLIEARWIGSEVASTQVEYFGRTYDSPIMIAPMAPNLSPEGAQGLARAAGETNTLFWSTVLAPEDLAFLREREIPYAAASKPLANHDRLCDKIRKAEQEGAAAFFIDIDHLFSQRTGGWDSYDFLCPGDGDGGRQTEEDLYRYAHCSTLPVILKGVLSVQDALACHRAGIAGVVASHHHGQVPCSVPPALAVQRIRAAVGPDYPLFLDCGIRSGYDAFKALALGANGVLVGRQLLPAFLREGGAGVAKKLNAMNTQLRYCLDITGSPDVGHVDPACLVPRSF